MLFEAVHRKRPFVLLLCFQRYLNPNTGSFEPVLEAHNRILCGLSLLVDTHPALLRRTTQCFDQFELEQSYFLLFDDESVAE